MCQPPCSFDVPYGTIFKRDINSQKPTIMRHTIATIDMTLEKIPEVPVQPDKPEVKQPPPQQPQPEPKPDLPAQPDRPEIHQMPQQPEIKPVEESVPTK